MIDVQHVDGRMYYVWLDERLLAAIGRGVAEALIEDALTATFSVLYPELFCPAEDTSFISAYPPNRLADVPQNAIGRFDPVAGD